MIITRSLIQKNYIFNSNNFTKQVRVLGCVLRRQPKLEIRGFEKQCDDMLGLFAGTLMLN